MADTPINELVKKLLAEARRATIRADGGKGFYGKITLHIKNGELDYVERTETIR